MQGLRITVKRARTNTSNNSPVSTKKPQLIVSPETNKYSEPINTSSFEPLLSSEENIYRSTIRQSPTAIRKAGLKDSEIGREIRNEIMIYKTLQHEHGKDVPYIVPFQDSSFNKEQEKTSPSSYIYFNMNRLNGANLIRYSRTMPSSEKYSIAIHAAKALQWLADQGFTHGDIKMDNIFRSTDGSIRLIDLGLSQTFRKERIKMFDGIVPRADKWSAIRDTDAFVKNILDKMDLPLPKNLRDGRLYIEDTLRKTDAENPQVAMHNFYQGIIDYYTLKKNSNAKIGGNRRTRRKYRRHH